MKKKAALTLLLCTCLTSCVPKTELPPTSTDTSQESEQEETTTTPDIVDSDTQTRIAYYEHLVNELQQELLNIKTELYVSRVEYESRIAELEGQTEANPPQETPPEPSKDEAVDYTYEVTDGNVTITSYIGSEKKVNIPSTINGYPVISIGDRTFENHASITSITIPSSVTSIGWFAFSGCIGLTEISIPKSVISIGYGAFQNCNSKLTVKCDTDSYAKKYANSYGMITSN